MKKNKLWTTDIEVSKICLGTMTWGCQNTEEEAHEQLDYALDNGINFIDTAELYAIPIDPKTYGKTESYIGNRIKKRGRRDDFVLATKVAGPGKDHIRENAGFSSESILQAVWYAKDREQSWRKNWRDTYSASKNTKGMKSQTFLTFEWNSSMNDEVSSIGRKA